MNKMNYFEKQISLGVCYYPEQWDESLWETDLKRMLAVGIKTVRVAEFAWTIFEPDEGRYQFNFFDRFLELASQMGMRVIFSTPTATPPAWLTEHYPEVLNTTMEGIAYRHGCRRHYNYNSPRYIEFVKNLVTALGAHYGKHPAIIGWQIDNEINCELDEFYSESDDIAFRRYVKEKYATLEQLNQAWGTVFWNQTYTSWEQIHLPQKTPHNSTNPHRVLDYIRFISHSARGFVRMQSEIIRSYLKEGDFITTNGLFGNVDNHQMNRESLDVYMYDSYPNFAYALTENPLTSDDLNDRKWSKYLSQVRSISPVFGIMEQQSGANGWNTRMEAPTPKPGQIMLWTMQSIAHGADFVSFFRWRTSIMGTEIYWHGILDYSGRENWRIAEVANISKKVEKLDEISGAHYRGTFAVLEDYDNMFHLATDKWHQRIYKESNKGIFNAAQKLHTPMDYIYVHQDTKVQELLKYPVIFYPHAVILSDELTQLLTEYVQAGGVCILGCRTGYMEDTGKCITDLLPGLIREYCGVDVVDYTFVGPADKRVEIEWDGTLVEAAVFHDILEALEGAVVEGRYTGNYYSGKAGLIKKAYGKGCFYYFGGSFSESGASVFLEKMQLAEPFQDILTLNECCELAVRVKGNNQYFFILNYSDDETEMIVKDTMRNMFTGKDVSGVVRLAAYETQVLKYKLVN